MRSHHAPPKGSTPPWATHPGRGGCVDLEEIEDHAPFHPDLWRLGDTTCFVCGRIIEQGHTYFHPAHHCKNGFTMCWECGTALMLWLGYYDQADVDQVPPFGGPAARLP